MRVTDCPAPLCVRCTADGHGLVSGAPCVVQVNVIVTALRYQPNFVFACALLTWAVIDGSWRAVESDEPVKSVSPPYDAATCRVMPGRHDVVQRGDPVDQRRAADRRSADT